MGENDDYDYAISKPTTIEDVEDWLDEQSIIANSLTSQYQAVEAKRELYILKSKINSLYSKLPSYPAVELEWDKEEVIRILKEKSAT